MKAEVALPCSQEAVTYPYPEPYAFSPKLPILLP